MGKSSRITSRIRKLLDLSNDQEGTPEGTLAISQAMKLMAEYGVSSEEVSEEEIDTTVDSTSIYLGGISYYRQHRILIDRIADALNCVTIGTRSKGTKIDTVEVFGRGIDRERVVMLYSAASPAMVAAAMKAIPSGSYNIRMRRLSYMIGYSTAIYESLSGHENEVRNEHGDSKSVILADRENAEKALSTRYPHVTKGSSSRISAHDYENGIKEGRKFDTGSKARLGSHREIGA